MSNRKSKLFYLIAAISICFSAIGYGQENGGIYIDPNRGEKIYRKTVVMNSNRSESILGNWGIFGKENDPYSGVWPMGSGHGHIHEMSMLVAADVTGTNGTNYQIVSESYGGSPDRAPDGTEYWWNPLPGYANEHRRYVSPFGDVDTTSTIAHSADPTSWPESWPGKDATWNGTWNGHFGQNQFNADDEAIYLTDDFYNAEFPYYPIPSDTTKRGLGIQVETRLFQWAHPLAQDQIFIHFRVTNQSETDYNGNMYLGAFADTHPGGLGDAHDMDAYSIKENMVYAWAYNNKGVWATHPEIPPGYMGWKYLESPGDFNDGKDNDNDGLLNERRDNGAGQVYEGRDAIITAFSGANDLDKFLTYFGYADADAIPAVKAGIWWTGDENGNWSPEIDDVGADGIGKFDPNYVEPDADGTEANGRPDQGEPNFGSLDKDESDQIGLTSFYSPLYGSMIAKNDAAIWTRIQPGVFETPAQNANNLWVFASGPFNLTKKQSERFSVCWIFGEQEGTIFRNAITSQNIYNNNYRFTKPPLPPVVKAVPGDHKVTLYWDDLAEKSVDPVYGQDFEGYRIYKSTDPTMSENLITDGYGNNTYRQPIAQFDKKDNIKGMHPVALGEELGNQYSTGIHYFMGDDGGLNYYFEDDDVINGVTYYYAVVSYDKGYYPGMDDRDFVSMSPSESGFSFTYKNGLLVKQSQNTAIVIPNASASNYVPGYTDADENGYIAKVVGAENTGKVSVTIINPDDIPENNNYEITFTDSVNTLAEKMTATYSVYNTTTNTEVLTNVSVPMDTSGHGELNWGSTVFNGMMLNFENVWPSVTKVTTYSGWTDNSQTNLQTDILRGSTGLVAMNLTLEVTDTLADNIYNRTQKVYFKAYDTDTHEKINFQFTKDSDSDFKLSLGDEVTFLSPASDSTIKRVWKLSFSKPADTTLTPIVPQPGDTYKLISDVPFSSGEKFTFNTIASSKKEVPADILNKVAVVPNPYILTAKWEKTSALVGRGDRQIHFIHLPAECTIRIFTQNGYLIKTIEHSGLSADGTEIWNLTTSEGLEVAFGIYVFHVESPNIGSKIGTFAIIN